MSCVWWPGPGPYIPFLHIVIVILKIKILYCQIKVIYNKNSEKNKALWVSFFNWICLLFACHFVTSIVWRKSLQRLKKRGLKCQPKSFAIDFYFKLLYNIMGEYYYYIYYHIFFLLSSGNGLSTLLSIRFIIKNAGSRS